MAWETCTAMPMAHYGMLHAAVGGKIYVVGGYLSTTVVYEYDPVLNTWASKATSIVSCWDNGATERSGTLVVVANNDTNEFRVYTPGTNSWSIITDSPATSTSHVYGWMATDASANVYQGGGDSTAIHRWNGASWTSTVNTMPTAWRGQKALLGYNNKIYIVGGINGSTATANLYEYDPTTAPVALTALPSARYNGGWAHSTPWFYYCGGVVGGVASNDVVRYDITLNAWTAMEDMPYAVHLLAAVAVSNKLYVIGGFTAGSAAQSVVYRTDAGYDELSATIESEAEVWPFPSLELTSEAGAELLSDFAITYQGGMEADSFVDIGSTGEASFDALFPATDLYPDTTLYPAGDW